MSSRTQHAPPDEQPTKSDLDNDDDLSTQMTASYSEISFKSDATLDMPNIPTLETAPSTKKRPATLNYDRTDTGYCPLSDSGIVHRIGDMTHFIAENVERKIKLSSPQAKKIDTPSRLPVTITPKVDARLLNDLECEAHRLATSIDNLTENLCGILHSISSITADNVDVYKNAVSKMSNAMDANIKSMYTMMAKAEEVSATIKSAQTYHSRIKEIKRIVDLLESYV